jgi:RimJ/RimL family protein N-acetyltransferase
VAIYARPYDPFDGNPVKHTLVLDALVAQPGLLSYPMSPDEARVFWAGVLTNPTHVIFEAWQDGRVVGIILLTRIVPHVDAVLTFLFTDNNLVGKRKLLTNFLGFCFTDLGFHRLSMEIPEGARKIDRFARRVLGFRYEGEARTKTPDLPSAPDRDAISKNSVWVARQGARREASRFDGERWSDVVTLRLLASEWEAP